MSVCRIAGWTRVGGVTGIGMDSAHLTNDLGRRPYRLVQGRILKACHKGNVDWQALETRCPGWSGEVGGFIVILDFLNLVNPRLANMSKHFTVSR